MKNAHRWPFVLTLLTGCTLSLPRDPPPGLDSGPDGDAIGDATVPDGDATAPDGDATAPDADAQPGDQGSPDATSLCGWPFAPALFDPCTDVVVAGAKLVLANKKFVYDTDTAVLSPAAGGVSTPPSSTVDGARAIWVEGFAVANDATLRVVGSMPLMIVSTKEITIDGTVDVSSFNDGSGGFDIGAGATNSSCSPPQAGARCNKHGASAGGGGGFATAGSGGDSGGVGHDCGDGDGDGKPPTSGGDAFAARPTTIRGGCAGADGDYTTEGGAAVGDRGNGGPGGGAIHLTAQGDLKIDGLIHAGGAGGGPGSAHRASGGGGGSGGYIGLETTNLVVTADATLAANGGGGGGGCDGTTAGWGDNGQPSATVAQGGVAQGTGGRGNDGGYLALLPEAPDAAIERGGGGGGGGVGFVLLSAPSQTKVDVGATISPPAVWVQ